MSLPLGQIKSKSLRKLLLDFRKSKDFNAESWTSKILENTRTHLLKSHLNTVVLNVSGGVDSAVTYKLFKLLQEKYPNVLKKIIPVIQPIHSSEWSLNNVIELLDGDLNGVVFDQTEDYDKKVKDFESLGFKFDKVALGNLRSSMRTPIVYAIAHSQRSEGLNAFVAGTGNFDEDHYAGFFSKAGDGVVDISLIGELHKSEVYLVAKYLKVPQCILETTPSADLGDVDGGDEDALGVTYEFIELYTGLFLFSDSNVQKMWLSTLDEEGKMEFEKSKEILETVHQKNKHKSHFPIVLKTK